MTNAERRSWDEVVNTLRSAASEVRSAVGRPGSLGAGEEIAATRLKSDVSRLEDTAADLLTKFSSGLSEGKSELESSFDRERAERNADQIKTSLEELASLASRLTSDVASTAGSSLKQAEPELKSAVRALEAVAGSAADWVRAVIDAPRESPRTPGSVSKPSLDDL